MNPLIHPNGGIQLTFGERALLAERDWAMRQLHNAESAWEKYALQLSEGPERDKATAVYEVIRNLARIA